ncbi:hypothetical protein AALO_G00076700, partial [Alosa alosa]
MSEIVIAYNQARSNAELEAGEEPHCDHSLQPNAKFCLQYPGQLIETASSNRPVRKNKQVP